MAGFFAAASADYAFHFSRRCLGEYAAASPTPWPAQGLVSAGFGQHAGFFLDSGTIITRGRSFIV